jgi:hypothetical protein
MAQPTARYRTIHLKIPANLLDSINGVTKTPGTWQRPFQRIRDSLKKVGDEWTAVVREEDIAAMKELAVNPKEGGYEGWASEILKLNDMSPDEGEK